MVALVEPFSLEADYKLLVLDIMDLASVMDMVTVITVTDLVMDLDTDLVSDLIITDTDLDTGTITTPGHRPNGMEMLLLTPQMMNTLTQSPSM